MIKVFFARVQPVEPPLLQRWAAALPRQLQPYGAAHAEDRGALPRLFAHTLLRYTLFHVSGIAGPLALAYGPHQKPYLADYPHLHFNLSHTGPAVLCAVGDQEVGVDVQALRPVSDRLAQKVMTPGEYAQYLQAGDPECFFARLWALKESYMKFTGKGLSLPLQSMAFSLAPQGASLHGSSCLFAEYQGIPGCCAAACTMGEAPDPALREISLQTLQSWPDPAIHMS